MRMDLVCGNITMFLNLQTRLYGGVKRGENRSETQHYSDLFVGCLLATVAYVVQFPFKTLSARVTHTWVYYIVHYVIVITGLPTNSNCFVFPFNHN